MTPTSRVTSTFDIAIIGAGAAGICAAWAARRAASVVLIDSSQRLGGVVTAALHRSICGLYASAPKDALDTLNDGAQRELVSRIVRNEPARVSPKQLGKAWVLEFPAAAWESALAEMCRESGADVRVGCRVEAVRREGNRITAIQILDTESTTSPLPVLRERDRVRASSTDSPDGPHPNPLPAYRERGKEGERPSAMPQWIAPTVIIDCTGGGNVLRLAGPDTFQPPDETTGRILGGFAARLSGISGDPELLRLQIPYALAKAVEGGTLPKIARFTAFHPGPGPGEGVCKLAVNPGEYTEDSACALLARITEYLAVEIPSLAGAKIIEKSPRVLPRDGLRLDGRFVVSESDVLQGRKHPGGAVHAWWPIEKWDQDQGPTYAYPPAGQHYDIPPDALRSAAVDNLLAAGACLSATSAAMASIRVSGICMATGSAAGKLAVSLVKGCGLTGNSERRKL